MGPCPDGPAVPPPPAHRPPPGAVPCRVCGRAVHGTAPVCFCCRTVAAQLRLPLVPVLTLCEYRVGGRTHRRFRAYKDAPVAEVREESRRILVDELDRGCADPVQGPAARLGAWSVVTTVPSSTRPGRSPVEALVDGVPGLAARHRRLLRRGRVAGGHLQAGRERFVPADGVGRDELAGLAVLVVDDTTTTGAAVQSAAASLRLVGARVVGALVVGRALAAGPGGDGAVPDGGAHRFADR